MADLGMVFRRSDLGAGEIERPSRNAVNENREHGFDTPSAEPTAGRRPVR